MLNQKKYVRKRSTHDDGIYELVDILHISGDGTYAICERLSDSDEFTKSFNSQGGQVSRHNFISYYGSNGYKGKVEKLGLSNIYFIDESEVEPSSLSVES